MSFGDSESLIFYFSHVLLVIYCAIFLFLTIIILWCFPDKNIENERKTKRASKITKYINILITIHIIGYVISWSFDIVTVGEDGSLSSDIDTDALIFYWIYWIGWIVSLFSFYYLMILRLKLCFNKTFISNKSIIFLKLILILVVILFIAWGVIQTIEIICDNTGKNMDNRLKIIEQILIVSIPVFCTIIGFLVTILFVKNLHKLILFKTNQNYYIKSMKHKLVSQTSTDISSTTHENENGYKHPSLSNETNGINITITNGTKTFNNVPKNDNPNNSFDSSVMYGSTLNNSLINQMNTSSTAFMNKINENSRKPSVHLNTNQINLIYVMTKHVVLHVSAILVFQIYFIMFFLDNLYPFSSKDQDIFNMTVILIHEISCMIEIFCIFMTYGVSKNSILYRCCCGICHSICMNCCKGCIKFQLKHIKKNPKSQTININLLC